jgi:hypothetical protein
LLVGLQMPEAADMHVCIGRGEDYCDHA